MSGQLAIGGLASGLDTNSIIQQLMSIERRPLDRLKERQETLTFRRELLQMINRRALQMQQTAFEVSLNDTFNRMRASSTNSGVVSASVTSASVTEATYELNVSQVAQNHRVASARQSDAASHDAGLSIDGGTFRINGVDVTVQDDFSLNDIARAINNARTGVTASVMDKTLIFTSGQSGRDGAIVAEDVGDAGVLQELGMITVSTDNLASGATVTASSEQAGATADNLVDDDYDTNWLAEDADKATPDTPVTATVDLGESRTFNNVVLSQVTGAASPNYHSGDFLVEVSQDGVNFEQVAEGALADIEGDTQSVTFGSVSAQYVRVSIISAHDQGGETESQGLSQIEVYNNEFSQELRAAQDAIFTVDGLAVERSSNRVDDLIDGLVINIQGEGLSYLSVEKDLENTVSIVGGFVKEYNSLMRLVYNKLTEEKATEEELKTATDMESFLAMRKRGLLRRDTLLQDLQARMKNHVGASVANLMFAGVGITSRGFEGGSMTEEGKMGLLEFDADKFRDELKKDPDRVQALFSNRGEVKSAVERVAAGSATNTYRLENGNVTQNVFLSINGTRYTEVADPSHFDPDNGVDEYFIDRNSGRITFDKEITQGSRLEVRYSYVTDDATRMSVDDDQFGTGNGAATTFYLGNRYIRAGTRIEVDGELYERVADPSMLSESNQYYLDHDRGRLVFHEAPEDGAELRATYGFLVGNTGIATAISQELRRMTGMGAFYHEERALDNQIATGNRSMEHLEKRLQSREDNLWAEFARLERAMSDIHSQGEWLTSQLASLPGFGT